MKAAIIGANGFIGSRVIEMFHLGDGPSLVAVTREASRSALPARFAIDTRFADAFDSVSLAKALDGCGAVVFAARCEPAQLKKAVTVLCRAAAEADVRRIVYLSSATVHGPNPLPATNEKSRLDLDSLDETANAHAAAERQLFAECRRTGLSVYALRPNFVYGPRSSLIASIAVELRTERAWLLGNGQGLCNGIYVDNLVAAIRLALKAKEGAGQPYLIGDAENTTWREFYHAIARELDLSASRIHYTETPPPPTSPTWAALFQSATTPLAQTPAVWSTEQRAALQHSSYKLPFAAATKQLGYMPIVTFVDGIHRTCAWWRFAQGDYFAAA